MYYYHRLKDVRTDFDMSQREVAEILCITPQQYQLYESGKREMPMHLFIKLADFFDIPIDFLAGIDKNDYNENLTKQKEISYFYQKIRDIREDFDMTQKQVAEILNITTQQYQLYESGKREMPMHHFIALAEHYGVTIDYLVGRDKRNLFDKK